MRSMYLHGLSGLFGDFVAMFVCKSILDMIQFRAISIKKTSVKGELIFWEYYDE